MLYPQNNPYRQVRNLSGFWSFRFDPDNQGLRGNWQRGFEQPAPIAVPGSWNDQFADARDYLGAAWYATTFDLPWGWSDRRLFLRFGSVNYLADVWLNGEKLGSHEGGHLPFELELTGQARPEGNLLVVRVEGRLAPDRVPPGNVPPDPRNRFPVLNYPDTSFDFFPFCGIHRPVLLYAIPHEGIRDITVVTALDGDLGRVSVHVEADGTGGTVRFELSGHLLNYAEQKPLLGEAYVNMTVPDPALWQPGAPNRYNLTIELIRKGAVYDRYDLKFGIRTVAVEGDRLLLNGQPLMLRGFGRHEDFPVAGRGLLPPVIIKDYALMDWVGANSFRTSHYPYSDEMMALADELGVLVIDEIPAVGLFFGDEGEPRRLALCKQAVEELVARDKNHPSVIMWSIANEPHSNSPRAGAFFRALAEHTRAQDATRPVTLVSDHGLAEEAFDVLDVVCLNRYYGWYTQPGRLDEGQALLAQELDALHARFHKPLILTEFGADALPGTHAEPPEMFSEEYQAAMIEGALAVCAARPFVAGTHVWNLCDFKTAQAVHRVGGINYKGVFTRDRRPKLAARRLRALWKRENGDGD